MTLDPEDNEKSTDAKDDYVVLEGDRSVGRIYKEHGEARWFWSVNTSPYPAPPPNKGLAKSRKRRNGSSSNDMKR
jgi:hypothetical protein